MTENTLNKINKAKNTFSTINHYGYKTIFIAIAVTLACVIPTFAAWALFKLFGAI